ncbi:MAG: DUF2341 domain-containing protein, partial [Actinobacteria bacterium]|nr:DUF2341 domain-containing protein [Actinomycetota bacterium]
MPRESTKSVKRFAYYEAGKVLKHPTIRRSVILSGARRVGKTTILYQLIDEMLNNGIPAKHILYVSFDHPILKCCTVEEILEAYEENVSGSSENLCFFFDEVHFADQWDLWIKYLYDHRRSCKIIATGSASPVLVAHASESGVGRWTIIKIPTLSFYEYCELVRIKDLPKLPSEFKPSQLGTLSSEKLGSLMHSLAVLQKYFHRYLLIGGFPEIALSDDIPFTQRILREDVVDKVLKRDLTVLFNVRNVAELEKVFLYLCIHSGGLVTIDTIAKEIGGVARQTVSNYLSLLETANLIYISNPVEIGGNSATMAGWFNGYIDESRIYNAALSATQVQQLYNQPTAVLVLSEEPNPTSPAVSTVTPSIGSPAGGTSVTVGGSGFNQLYQVPVTITNNGPAVNDYQVQVTNPIYNETGLVGSWHMEGNSLDSSGNNNNGTDSNVTYGTAYGKYGQGASFNGSSSYINLSSFPTVTNPASWAFWVDPSSVSGGSYGGGIGSTIVDGNENGGSSGYVIGINNSNKLWFWPSGGNDKYSSGTIPLNTWTYVVCTYNGSNLVIYINGAVDSTQSMSAPQTPTFLKIGSESWVTGYMNGSIDEVRIYNRALSSTEVSNLYAAHAAPNYQDVRFYDSDGVTPLSFWMQQDGAFWVRVPYVPNGTKTIYARYGR